MKIFCNSCCRVTNHEILKEVNRREDTEDSIVWNEWKMLQCKGCEEVTLLQETSFSDDVDFHENEESGELIPELRVHSVYFPIRSDEGIRYKYFLNVPSNIWSIYRETISAFLNDSFILCAAGLRAIVEGICQDGGISDGPLPNQEGKRGTNLEAKIEGLKERGILTESNAETLHKLRFLGNDAVHDLAKPHKSSLITAIGIIENVLEQIYDLSEKGEMIVRKRKR